MKRKNLSGDLPNTQEGFLKLVLLLSLILLEIPINMKVTLFKRL